MNLNHYILVGTILASFFFGVKVNSWYYASQQLIIEQTTIAERKAFAERESLIASTMETKLSELRANEKIIENFHREVVERPVYRNVCIDDDGLSVINQYATGITAEPSSTLP